MSTIPSSPPSSLQLQPPNFDGLFPLPLTAIEAYMATDARPGFTMMCDLEMHFEGSLDREAFDSALAFALARAPLFQSTLELKNGLPWAWVRSQQQPEVVWTENEPPRAGWYDRPLDLTQQVGLRIWVRAGGPKSSILIHFHHACSDGLGGCTFIEDLLAGYANARQRASPPSCQPVLPRTLNAPRLALRGDPGTAGRSLWLRLQDPFVGAWKGYRFLFDRPLPLSIKTCHPEPPRDPQAPAARDLVYTCSEELLAGLRAVTKQHGGTVNDLLLRDMFLVLRGWNGQSGEAPHRRFLRILMPQNLRGEADAGIPVANVVGFATLTRRVSACGDPGRLLKSIHRETEAIRSGQLSRYTNGCLASLQAKGRLPWLVRGETCLASIILTNIGNPLRHFITQFPKSGTGLVVGDVTLSSITGVPGIRPLTRSVFCVFSNGKQLTICVKHDPATFSPADSQRLLDAFVAQLHATAAGG